MKQEYPKMLYLKGERGPSLMVNNEEQLKVAQESGYCRLGHGPKEKKVVEVKTVGMSVEKPKEEVKAEDSEPEKLPEGTKSESGTGPQKAIQRRARRSRRDRPVEPKVKVTT